MIDFIDIHTHKIESDENILSILNISLPCKEIPKKKYLSIGLHPWNTENFDHDRIKNELEQFAVWQNVLAIGECGLDRSIKTQIDQQVAAFYIHLNVAKKVEKPLIIHCVRAYSDLLEILKKEKFTGKFILHNFNGNKQQIDRFLYFDAFFSFSKQQLIRNPKLNTLLPLIPLERIFLETDDSVFTIMETYSLVSDLLNIPFPELKLQIIQNFNFLYNNILTAI